jgi:ribosome-binding factor A
MREKNESYVASRKLKQLCREVYRVVAQSMPPDVPVLVIDVYPAPDGSRLAVELELDAQAGASADEVGERLERLKGYLRGEIACAIQRKRTPELVFQIA